MISNPQVNLEIYPERVPGVPKLLARKFRPQIENVIQKQVSPNLKNLAVSVRRYVADKE